MSYQVEAASLTLSAAPSYLVDLAATPTSSFLRRAVHTGDTGAVVTWSATTSVPWLTVTPSGVSGDDAVLALVPAALAGEDNGTQHATVTFTYVAPGAAPATRSVDVGLTVDLPIVNYVTPYVAYLGEQLPVTIRGEGFASGGLPVVMFGDQPAASVQRKSDTELVAVPPAFAAVGRPQVTVANGFGLVRAGADLVVREHPSYAYAALSTSVGFQDRTVIYDAERDVVFSYCSWFGNYSATNPSTIQRYAYDQGSGAWTRTSAYVPQLWDIGLSPDGKYLVALATSRLWLLDPVTMTTLGSVDLTSTGLGTAKQLGVVNDGKVLIRDLGVAYSLVTHAFTPARFPGSIGIVVSADGGRAVVGDANSSDYVPLSIYDAGTGNITPSSTYEYFQLPSLDRTGDHYFSGGNLRDRTLRLIGGIPTSMGYMRPDGRRAYEVNGSNRTHLKVFDLTGSGPGFSQLADIVVADPIDGYWLGASLDSRFMFIPGPNRFIVVPLP